MTSTLNTLDNAHRLVVIIGCLGGVGCGQLVSPNSDGAVGDDAHCCSDTVTSDAVEPEDGSIAQLPLAGSIRIVEAELGPGTNNAARAFFAQLPITGLEEERVAGCQVRRTDRTREVLQDVAAPSVRMGRFSFVLERYDRGVYGVVLPMTFDTNSPVDVRVDSSAAFSGLFATLVTPPASRIVQPSPEVTRLPRSSLSDFRVRLSAAGPWLVSATWLADNVVGTHVICERRSADTEFQFPPEIAAMLQSATTQQISVRIASFAYVRQATANRDRAIDVRLERTAVVVNYQ